MHDYLQRKTADVIARGEKPPYGGLYGPSSSNRKDGSILELCMML
jgi:hypothetical protein